MTPPLYKPIVAPSDLIWLTFRLILVPFMIGFVWIISLPMPLKPSLWSSLQREILSQILLLLSKISPLNVCLLQNFLLTNSLGIFMMITFAKRPVRPLASYTGPSILHPNTCRKLYLAVVRHTLEYSFTTLHKLNIKSTNTISNRTESMQRFSCPVIRQQWKFSHDELLREADLPTLAKWRDVATLCYLFKIFHGLCSSPNPKPLLNPLSPKPSNWPSTLTFCSQVCLCRFSAILVCSFCFYFWHVFVLFCAFSLVFDFGVFRQSFNLLLDQYWVRLACRQMLEINKYMVAFHLENFEKQDRITL